VCGEAERGASIGDICGRVTRKAKAAGGGAVAGGETVAEIGEIARAAAAKRKPRQGAREIACGAEFFAHAVAAIARVEEELH
jgi:hypothetical protein